MQYIREENKELNDKYQQVSGAYEDLRLKEPNQGEHQLLKNLLKRVHEKCTRVEEACKQAMDLYLVKMISTHRARKPNQSRYANLKYGRKLPPEIKTRDIKQKVSI